jgi:glyceraldehyde 3-phosphate dehydrogenase
MSTRIAINGAGRVGRCILRTLSEARREGIELVAVNDLADARTLAHLYNDDTVHGRAKDPGNRAELRQGHGLVRQRNGFRAPQVELAQIGRCQL